MVSTTPVVEHYIGLVEDSTTNPVVKSTTIPLMECSITAAVVKSTAGLAMEKKKKKKTKETDSPAAVSTTTVVKHSLGLVEDSTTNPVVKFTTIPLMECSTTAPVVKSTAAPVGARKNFQVEGGPQVKVARAEVKREKRKEKRMKGGPQE